MPVSDGSCLKSTGTNRSGNAISNKLSIIPNIFKIIPGTLKYATAEDGTDGVDSVQFGFSRCNHAPKLSGFASYPTALYTSKKKDIQTIEELHKEEKFRMQQRY